MGTGNICQKKSRTTYCLRRSKTFQVLPPSTHFALAWTPGRPWSDAASLFARRHQAGTVEERINGGRAYLVYKENFHMVWWSGLWHVLDGGIEDCSSTCWQWTFLETWSLLPEISLSFLKTPATDSRHRTHSATLQRTGLWSNHCLGHVGSNALLLWNILIFAWWSNLKKSKEIDTIWN